MSHRRGSFRGNPTWRTHPTGQIPQAPVRGRGHHALDGPVPQSLERLSAIARQNPVAHEARYAPREGACPTEGGVRGRTPLVPPKGGRAGEPVRHPSLPSVSPVRLPRPSSVSRSGAARSALPHRLGMAFPNVFPFEGCHFQCGLNTAILTSSGHPFSLLYGFRRVAPSHPCPQVNEITGKNRFLAPPRVGRVGVTPVPHSLTWP